MSARSVLIFIAVAGTATYLLLAGLAYAAQDFLLFHPTGESPAQLARMAKNQGVEEFSIPASNGVQLYGWHSRGTGDRLLIFFHGNGGHISAVSWLGHQLPGIDVIGISYRGFAGSEGEPSEAGLRLDALAVWRYATEDLGFSPKDIVLQGQSMGGGVAHHLLMEAHPAGVVFDSTFTSIEELAHAQMPFLPVSLLLRHPFRSYERAPKVTVPALVFHGSDDPLIPVDHGRRLAKLLPNATYVELPHHGHNDWTLDRPEAQAAWRDFLREVWGLDSLPAPE